MKLIRLIFEGSLPSWVSSKAPDLTLCSLCFKGSLKLYKLFTLHKSYGGNITSAGVVAQG